MSFLSRRLGIAGVTAGAVLCLVCGVPFIAAIVGFSGLSAVTIFSDLSFWIKVAVPVGSLVVLVLLYKSFANKRLKKVHESDL